jgi:hypothetical protein
MMPISKRDFGALIDAYADAKASRNPVLVNMVAPQLEQALDKVFAEQEPQPEVDQY